MSIEIIKIGRNPGSNFRINRDSVSNEQAMLIVSNKKKYLLIDCNSMNGTRLPLEMGDAKISQCMVLEKSVVLFGDYQCTIEDILRKSI